MLFVVGSLVLGAGDQAIKAQLEAHPLGPFAVTTVLDTGVTAADAQGRALVVLSQGIGASDVGDKLAAAAVPLLTMRPQSFDNLFMTGPQFNADLGLSAAPVAEIAIASPGHPMAAGRRGEVVVTMPAQLMAWGKPAPAAETVATAKGNDAQAVIFGYARGAAMAMGQAAPARRVAWFATTAAAAALTADGRALFQAAVAWAIDRR